MKTIKVLCVHGLGDHRRTTWGDDWKKAVLSVCPGQDEVQLQFTYLTYDDIFAGIDLSAWETMRAVWKLARSGAVNAFGKQRGVLGDVSDLIRWTAGYVVAWVEDDGFKRATRRRVLDTLVTEQPDVVLAHSLGSLVTYDAFTDPQARRANVATALARVQYVTLGSQLGNPFVVGNLAGGRLSGLPVRFWNHLFNPEDDVFTSRIRLVDATNFRQVDTQFDIDGFADHSAVEYLTHPNAVEHVWAPVAERGLKARTLGLATEKPRSAAVLEKKGRSSKRALLVGINEYPSEGDRLDGCVNDTFLMSSVLQECGVPPESIRVCLDRRATAKGIKERLEWLLDDPRPGDDRVFYYSGHGATIPEYGRDFEPDRKTETLVPWDFDWSPEHAIVDDEIFDLYSQLPYDLRFAMVLDCCHSGGMHRQGGPKARGLNPPDDIRHRELKWDPVADMWVERDFTPLNKGFSSKPTVNAAFFGQGGVSTRIGRASLVRPKSETAYRAVKRRAGSSRIGPYLPLIIEACAEAELSYEYRHGVTSYGAFTFALSQELRRHKRITFGDLVKVTRTKLKRLGYEQTPQVLGPKAIVDARVPWRD